MAEKISPLGHEIGKVYLPPKNGENGEKVGFVWEGNVYRLATKQEILEAQLVEEAKHPLVNRLSKRKVRQLKVQSSVRDLGQPKAKY